MASVVRCTVHDLALGPEGRCAICRRSEAPPRTSGSTRLVVTGLGLLTVALCGSVAYRARSVAKPVEEGVAAVAEVRQPQPEPVVEAAQLPREPFRKPGPRPVVAALAARSEPKETAVELVEEVIEEAV